MFERMIGGVVGMIGSYIEKKKQLGMYTADQMRVIRELEDHYVNEMSHEWRSSLSSMSSSTHSPAVSARREKPEGYFEKLEKRFEQSEFFKKEEFDL